MKSNAVACPVMGRIAQIVEDSKKSEADAFSNEREVRENTEWPVKNCACLLCYGNPRLFICASRQEFVISYSIQCA